MLSYPSDGDHVPDAKPPFVFEPFIDRSAKQNIVMTIQEVDKPGGAPVGTERIKIQVPQDVNEVSLLGEKLSAVRFEGTESYTFAGPPRPVALVSNVNIEYVPAKKAPAPKAKKPAARRR